MPTPWNDIALGNPNATTGAFNFVRGSDGDVSFDDTAAHAVMTSVMEQLGTNPFDATHGTNILATPSLTSNTPSQVEAEATQAVAGLVTAGEVQGFVVDASEYPNAINRLSLDLSWTSGTGAKQSKVTQV